MGRKSRGPWFWEARQQWFVTHKGKQIPLGTDEAEATRQWHTLEATAQVTTAGDSNAVLAVADAFLDWVSRHRKHKTYLAYRMHLETFCREHGTVKVSELKPHHVDTVVSQHPEWSKSTMRGFMVVINTALNWGIKSGHTTCNPLTRRLPLPPIISRGQSAVIPPEDYAALLAHANEPLRDFLIACRNSGTRPHIVASVQAKDFNEAASCWIISDHKTDHDGQPLVVHLNPTLVALTKRLVALRPTGFLFLNNDGHQWRDSVWGKAMRRLRQQLANKGITLKSRGIMYGFRHAFATEQLEANVNEAHVAALLGHKSTAMLHKHYSHLTSKHQALKAHLGNIKPLPGEVTDGDVSAQRH